MSNYRNIIAIALVVLLGVSLYSMVSNAAKQSNQLEQYLQEAQVCVDEGLIEKAVENYSKAIEVDDNVKYYNIIADLYFEKGDVDASLVWAEQAVSKFPEEGTGYLKAIRGYLEGEMYKNAFKTLEEYDGRGLYLQEVETYRNQMMALHFVRFVSIEDVASASSGYSAVMKSGKWGLMNSKAATAVKMKFKQIGYFANDLVAVCTEEDEWFFADNTGKYITNISGNIEGKITEVGIYNDGVFTVKNGDKYQYYTLSLTPCIGAYDYAGAFNNGIAAVKNGDKWSLIDKEGKQIGSQTYEDVVVDDRGICCAQNRIVVKTSGKYILLDATGKQVGKQQFDGALLPASSELFAVKVGSKWGYANLEGDIVIEPQYEDAKAFSGGFGAVCTDGLWGYIDNKNVMQIQQIYEDCRNFSSAGLTFVKDDSAWYSLMLYSKNY